MDIELIRKLVNNLAEVMGDNEVPAQQQFDALQAQLLLHIYDKLESIDDTLIAILNSPGDKP